ncbi:lipopolysaccharide-induced tumor necrosis factor-alpha factor homolog [Sitodiplosis mosellana]|uniref:lipopolysaccharide-induced tumor necrosis factor-alpha factor homolog n=1 Tax=Sitodiplosis mosellana TaxID=263140 RepID=UPI002444E3A1|nr:lipopolysaccharide-induced tumor necrosis factor-alpha factor homolog [Sitodiplosis mosellana]
MQSPYMFGPDPTAVQCPACGHRVLTRIVYRANIMTHLIAVLCCFLTGFLCCLLPYCIDSCKEAQHYCPACGAYLGTYSR